MPEDSQSGADEDVLRPAEKTTSLLAGVVAGIWGAVFVGSALTLLSPLLAYVPPIGTGVRVLTGVRVAEGNSVGEFYKRAVLGTFLGCSLVLAGAALNWMVEELDALGDKPAISEPQDETPQVSAPQNSTVSETEPPSSIEEETS